jgi:uncharacterized protein involved in response to NO
MFKVIFSGAFRPFFLLVGLYGPLTIVLWLLYYLGAWPLFPAGTSPVDWHMHEMLFGFVGAAIGGFLFTAVANWTGRPPLQGALLVIMTLAWIAGRLVMSPGLAVPSVLVAVVDMAYLVVVFGLLWRELYLGGNRRNYILLVVVGALLACNLLYHLAVLGWLPDRQAGLRGGMMPVLLLITIIGGRIIPAFTRNWLVTHQVDSQPPAQFNRLDAAAIAPTVLLVPCWMLYPYHPVTGSVLVVVAILHGIRLARWRGSRTLREPLLAVLHLAYAWLPVGLALLGVSVLAGYPASAGVHALTVGTMTTMIMAVSSRAALGHSGRPLASPPLLTLAFVLITVSALLRVGASILAGPTVILITGLTWSAAFVCFMIVIVPVLVRPSANASP